MKSWSVFVAAALFLSVAPLQAEPLPMPEKAALGEERHLLPKLLDALAAANEDAGSSLASFDALLAQLPKPTKFRGLVQFYRGTLLERQDRAPEAADALTESIRLLPAYTAPLIAASRTFAFNDRPGPAADYLLRASRLDPRSLDQLDDYEILNIRIRLDEVNDRDRALALSERLLATGWRNGSRSMISQLAADVLEARIEQGDTLGAAAMVPKIVSPFTFAGLLADRKYDQLRPSIEAWAGRRLEKQWPIFLEQAQAEWEASNDLEAGLRYVRALASAGHYRTAAATFLPLFDKIEPGKDQDLIFMANPLAGALAHLGRWEEAFGIFDKALKAWPRDSHANALNLTANRARLLFFKGDFETALSQFDEALKDAERWGSEVNQGALASMHLYRACSLAQLGRSAEDVTSSAVVMSRKTIDPSAFAYLQICRNDIGFAREALLQALEVEDTRAAVIDLAQPDDEDTYDSDFARMMGNRWKQLRSDPKLVAAVSRYGRIRPEPVNASAPVEQIVDRTS